MFKPRKWVTCARKYGSVASNWIDEMDVRWLEFVFRVKLSFAQSLMSLSNHFYVLFDLIAWNYNPDDLWTKSITFGSNFLGRQYFVEINFTDDPYILRQTIQTKIAYNR